MTTLTAEFSKTSDLLLHWSVTGPLNRVPLQLSLNVNTVYAVAWSFIVQFLTFVGLCRDPDAEEKMNPFAEQEAWESHQIGMS